MEENLTLDLLFSMVNSELEQLMGRCCIATAEGKKLLGALDHLTIYYGKCSVHVKIVVLNLLHDYEYQFSKGC